MARLVAHKTLIAKTTNFVTLKIRYAQIGVLYRDALMAASEGNACLLQFHIAKLTLTAKSTSSATRKLTHA